MKITTLLAVILLVFSIAGAASAQTVKIPKKNPLISVNIPKGWDIEEVDDGIGAESPDAEATVYFEVKSAKRIEQLADMNIEWLVKEHNVVLDLDSLKESDFEASGMEWSALQYEATSKEWGPSTVILAFGDTGKGRILMVTYWVTKKGEKKYEKGLKNMLDSIKLITAKADEDEDE